MSHSTPDPVPESVPIDPTKLDEYIRARVREVVIKEGKKWGLVFGWTSLGAVLLGLVSGIAYVWGFVDSHVKTIATNVATPIATDTALKATSTALAENEELRKGIQAARKSAMETAVEQLRSGLDLNRDLREKTEILAGKVDEASKALDKTEAILNNAVALGKTIKPEDLENVKKLLQLSMDVKAISDLHDQVQKLQTTTSEISKNVNKHESVMKMLDVRNVNGRDFLQVPALHVATHASVGGNLRVIDAIKSGKKVTGEDTEVWALDNPGKKGWNP